MRKYKILLFIPVFIIFSLYTSCKKEETKSSENNIISFVLKEQTDSAVIDEVNKQVTIHVKQDADLKKLSPEIKISKNATIKPASGDTVDFSVSPVAYTVTAEDGKKQEWQIYVIKEGANLVVPDLNNRSISSIAVDNSNTLWVGTDTGLFKSVENGYQLQNILISGKIFSLFYEESLNTLWAGTENGLSKALINGTNLSCSVISSSNLSNQEIFASYVDSSSKRWFGTALGITLNKDDSWKKSNFLRSVTGNLIPLDFENANINSISSWDGDYYFATNGQSVYRAYNFNDTVDAFSGASQLTTPYNGDAFSDTMFVVFTDSHGNIWMGGTNGLQEHYGHYTKANNTSYLGELPSPRIHAIAEAPDGKIWIGTENGLTVFDGSSWTDKSASLTNKFVTAIAFESNGKAWIGTKQGMVNINN